LPSWRPVRQVAELGSLGQMMNAIAFPRLGRLRKNRILATFATVAFVLILPAIIPLAIVTSYLGRRRVRSVIVASKCPACGAQLDLEAIARGDARWREIAREIWASSPPHVRLRLVRDVHAVCCACGAELNYREGGRSLAVRVR
jgi:hypothetical protein